MNIVNNSGYIRLYGKTLNWETIVILYNPLTEHTCVSLFYKGKTDCYYLQSQQILDNIKKESSCAICNYNKYTEALDFHHIIPEDKKYQISANVVDRKDFIEELQKCMCLCKCCHAHVTRLERRNKSGLYKIY
jgi:hypothetical protein